MHISRSSQGLTVPEICTLAGLTPRQVDYWTRTGLLTPLGKAAPGQGNYRHYDKAEVDKAKVVGALLRAGLALPAIRRSLTEILTVGAFTYGPVTITYTPESDPT